MEGNTCTGEVAALRAADQMQAEEASAGQAVKLLESQVKEPAATKWISKISLELDDFYSGKENHIICEPKLWSGKLFEEIEELQTYVGNVCVLHNST